MARRDTGRIRIRATIPFRGWRGRMVMAGDEVELPGETAKAIIRSGCAVYVESVFVEEEDTAVGDTEHRIAEGPQNRTDPPPRAPRRQKRKSKRKSKE